MNILKKTSVQETENQVFMETNPLNDQGLVFFKTINHAGALEDSKTDADG